MSISLTKVLEHAHAPAVTCCRFAAGTVISPDQLEDPALFPELERTGLLHLPADCLTIGQALGATLRETVEGFTPLTPDTVLDVQQTVSQRDGATPPPSHHPRTDVSMMDIRAVKATCPTAQGKRASVQDNQKTVLRKHIPIAQVVMGLETAIKGHTLVIRESLCQEALHTEALVTNLSLDIIPPDRYHEYSHTIMDVQPIAVKESGSLGEGVTRVLDGVVLVLTGTEGSGAQVGEFGHSAGPMTRTIMWGRPGAPDYGDILIKIHVTLQAKSHMQRPGPLAAHRVADILAQEIRQALYHADAQSVTCTETLHHLRRPGQPKVAIVKEIMGQGAMHDNLLMPYEPVGIRGAQAIFDLGNVPIAVSPLHLLDGCLHALTCVGPASKETSRHYWREPLILEVMRDEELDCCTVVLVGSPQAYTAKMYVSQLLGLMLEALEVDGVLITTEGFGNNHLDFASHIEQLGKRGIPVVGMTYAAEQGQLVMGNAYMDALIELNKSAHGRENEVLANNTLCPEDAIRAVALLKAKMAGEPIAAAPPAWDPIVPQRNLQRIEHATGRTVTRSANETALPRDNASSPVSCPLLITPAQRL